MYSVFKPREKTKGWCPKRNLCDLPEETAQTRQQKRQHFHAAATTGDRVALQTPARSGAPRRWAGRKGKGDPDRDEKVGSRGEGNPLHPDAGEEEEGRGPGSLGKPF